MKALMLGIDEANDVCVRIVANVKQLCLPQLEKGVKYMHIHVTQERLHLHLLKTGFELITMLFSLIIIILILLFSFCPHPTRVPRGRYNMHFTSTLPIILTLFYPFYLLQNPSIFSYTFLSSTTLIIIVIILQLSNI